MGDLGDVDDDKEELLAALLLARASCCLPATAAPESVLLLASLGRRFGRCCACSSSFEVDGPAFRSVILFALQVRSARRRSEGTHNEQDERWTS